MTRRAPSLPRPAGFRIVLALGLFPALLGPSRTQAQFPPDSFTNLKVLPADIGQRELLDLMAGFTRALAVRCTHCHVGEEGQPLSTFDFPSDDKPAKRKARVMIDMVRHINESHLAELPERVEPPLEVECVTCHRGVTEPRQLQDVLLQTYAAAGLDSTVAAYRGLRERYYGRAAYDFGEVPLVDVANGVRAQGTLSDAVALLELNLEMHPESRFARRQHAGAALQLAFAENGVEAGVERYRKLRQAYGAEAFPPFVFGQVGQGLTRGGKTAEAVALYRLAVEAHPELAPAHAALGDALAAAGEVEAAIESYERALELDPNHRRSAERLRELRDGGGRGSGEPDPAERSS